MRLVCGTCCLRIRLAYGELKFMAFLLALPLEHLPARPIFTTSLKNLTVTIGSTVSLDVVLYTVNTPSPFLIWCKDLPHVYEGVRYEDAIASTGEDVDASGEDYRMIIDRNLYKKDDPLVCKVLLSH